MAWEYLPELDERLRVVADFLKGRTADKCIVDLNCLEARLLRFIEPDYRTYTGNDILDHFPSGYPRTLFVMAPDDVFCRTVPKCDILVAVGYAPRVSGRESVTLPESLCFLIGRHEPEIVAIETTTRFDEIPDMPDGYGMALDRTLYLGKGWTHHRRVRIWERVPVEAR